MDPFEAARHPPLPVSLDDAYREITYLRKQLFRARQDFAGQVVEREKDRRAARGNIKAVAAENAELRKVIGFIDAELDEFGAGYRSVPALTDDPMDVCKAVKEAMDTLYLKVAQLTVANQPKRKKKTNDQQA